VSPRGQQRLVAELAGVAVAGALLVVPVDLADERVNVDDQPLVAWAGAGAAQRLGQDAVELTDVPERERAQERPERRRRHRPVTDDLVGAPGAQPSQSSIEPAPSSIACTSDRTLRPRPRGARRAPRSIL